MFSNKLNYKVINFTMLMLLFYISISNVDIWFNFFKNIALAFLPFIISFTISYYLYPFTNILTKKGFNKKLSIALVIIFISIIILVIAIITLPIIYKQFLLFAKYILTIMAKVGDKYNLNLGIYEIKLMDYFDNILKHLSNIISNGTFNILNQSISFITNFILIYITTIYFIYNMEKIRVKIKTISLKISNKLYLYLKCLDQSINNYLKGLSIIMLIQFLEYTFLFLLIGHPNWLLLGFLASITTVIPYFGAMVTNLLGVIIAASISQKVLIGTIIICIIGPLIDSYLISPKIYEKTSNVNPLVIIIVIFIGEKILGVLGILLALPIYLLLRTTYQFFKFSIKKQVFKLAIDTNNHDRKNFKL